MADATSGLLRKVVAFLIALPLFLPPALAQEATVQGIVTDENGNSMPGASIIVVGTSRGTTSSASGEYSIRAKEGDVLEFQFLGYEKQQVKVQKATSRINVKMVPDRKLQMDEVVVIGYGTVKKTDMTGSVANVKMSDIKDVPVLSVDQALQGRIAGADIMSTTGEPGATTSIRIRGTRSISASNEPLIVVDGVMDAIRDLNDINSADIESVTVLKDASSTAIYGSRGSNGVIIITTKKGRSISGKPSITLKADIGFSQLPRGLDLMDASEFAQYRNDYAYFSSQYENVGDGTPLSKYPYKDPLSLGKGTDWIDEITRTAPYQNYNLSMSGGSEKTTYYASLGYNDTRGIIQNSGLSRITGRLNLDHQLFKWLKVGYKGAYTYRDQDANLAEIGGTAYYQAAIYLSPLLDPQADYNPLWGNGQKINTPRSTIDLNTNNLKRLSTSHTVYFEVDLAKNLKLRSQQSYYAYQRHTYRYYPSTLPKKTEGEGGEAYRAEYDEYSLSSENTISYLLDTESGHHIDFVGGFTAYKYKSNNFTLNGKGYMDDDVMWNNMNAVIDKETYTAGTSMTTKTKMSFLARFNYNYKQRYYVTVLNKADRPVPEALHQVKPFAFPLERECVFVIFANGRSAAFRQVAVSFPIMAAWPMCEFYRAPFGSLEVEADGGKSSSVILADMDGILAQEFEERLPGMTARIVLGTLLKEGAYYGGLVAIGNAGMDPTVKLIAMLAAGIGGAAYRSAMNTADTRSWELLPKEFQLAQFPMPENREVTMVLRGNGGRRVETVRIPAESRSAIIFVSAPSARNVRCHVLPIKSR